MFVVITELPAFDRRHQALQAAVSALAERPWQAVRPQLRVKLLPQDGELYVLAESQARVGKERGMRRRRLKAYWKRLGELQRQQPARDALLKKLGVAQERAGRIATSLVTVDVAPDGALTYQLNRDNLSARCADARAAICCAPTWPPTIRN